MRKIIVELLRKYFQIILHNWITSLSKSFSNKLSHSNLKTLVEHSLNTFIEVIEKSDYSLADEYLIELYNLCDQNSIDLLGVSQLFSNGRFTIVNHLEKDSEGDYNPLIILGFIEEVIEQLYARYSVLHQETKMKELVLDRDRLKQKLDLNQQYLENILHSSDSAIMVLDKNDKFISWNKGAEKIFGYSESEILGNTPEIMFPDEKKYKDELKFIRESVKQKGFYKILETQRVKKDRSIVPIQLSVNILTDSDGNYAGRSVIAKDYTEIKKLQQQIDQSEKLVVLGQMAAGIAHEIGNPLTSISSLVQILQRKTKDEFNNTQLASIKENIDRISKIVRELVDFSRPPGYEKSLTQVADIIKTALGIVKYDKRIKDVKFQTQISNDLPIINIIPDQLLQVFVNILINALDATKGKGKIEVNAFNDNHFIYIDITDDGCGIDPINMDKLFDPFFTTKNVGQGTGLGLSVSYGIMKKFNGDIKVKSELKKGTTFTLVIPIE